MYASDNARDTSIAAAPAARHVYVHVPFCARRCSYCDFAIAVRREIPVDEYIAGLETELRMRFDDLAPQPVDTIYFGGGTPSRLGGEGLVRALEVVTRQFPASDNAEITIEANPEDVSPAAARVWFDAGINRVSLGAQSFDDNVLAWMHRTHDAAKTEAAVRDLRDAGISNLSLDLIFALPAELRRNFPDDLERILRLQPAHVSLYGLTIEPHTALGKWVASGITSELDEAGYEADYLHAHERLADAGLLHYEVSNYGKPGRESRHNSSYWRNVPYVGLGPSAHGFDGLARRWNHRHYAAWLQALKTGDPLEGSEQLTEANRGAEAVYLGLRTWSGLALDGQSEEAFVQPWIDAGWAEFAENGRLRCTVRGWLRLDALAASLTHRRSR